MISNVSDTNIGKKVCYRRLTVSEYKKLLRSRVTLKLYIADDVGSVANNVFVIGLINKNGVDYLVGVEKRFVCVGTSFLIIKNGSRIIKLNKVTSTGGGPRLPKSYRGGGPRLPKNSRGRCL